MKRTLSTLGILSLAFLFMSAINIMESPQDPPNGKKAKKHIKMVKIVDGEKMELDTILEGDQVFVWQGDTIGGGKAMKWVGKDAIHIDSLHRHLKLDIDYEIDDDGKGNVFIIKSDEDGHKTIKEFRIDSDSLSKLAKSAIIKLEDHGEHKVMMWHSKDGKNKTMFSIPPPPGKMHTTGAPRVMRIKKQIGGNVIDLSDPGIISYEKKKLRDGREKITIIREEVKEDELNQDEELFFHGPGMAPEMIHAPHPAGTKAIKIMKKGDGDVDVIEEEGIWNVKEGDENIRVIEEDGKVIRIKEINKDGKKEIEVEVKEEKK